MPQQTANKRSAQTSTLDSDTQDNFVIPDLCQISAVLFILILTQFLALFIVLINTDNRLVNWLQLGLISTYCHAVALSFAVLICTTRHMLMQQSNRFIIGYFLLSNILLTWLIGWLGTTVFLPDIVESPALFQLKSSLISLVIAAICLRYFYLRQAWRRQRQAELKARIQALQARIRPHFLFNSMNSIASLIMIDPDRAEEAVLDLSSLFRATLDNQKALIPLDDEITLCRRYLNIESLRLGERLQVKWDLRAPAKSLQVPPLILQPLFENAIYHGIQPLTQGGLVKVETHTKQDFLYILISNPYQDTAPKHSGNHIALENIESRLKAIYGERAILKTSRLDELFTVTIRIPLRANIHHEYCHD